MQREVCIFPSSSQSVLTKHEECVCRLHEYQNAPKQILIENAVFDVVSMMFYTEG